jgi:acetyl-CoA C-acetyltransferase
MLAADSIALGRSQIVAAGGQENMTLAPHLLENSRAGYRMGHASMTDSMIKDGLWDPYNNFHMGEAAELCVRENRISREEQDQFAKESYELALQAQKNGWFQSEIAPVEIPARDKTITVSQDEEPGKVKFDKIAGLRPAFNKEGTITAANASKINDGAACVIVASEKATKEKNLKPLAKILAHSTFAQDPKWFTTAPITAIKKVCEQAQLTVDQIDLFEINEAFAVVTLAAMKELKIPRNKVNVHGGAIAIGHPIGGSGARLLTTLVHGLKTQNKKYGLVTLCIGGGEAVAMIVERV